MLSRGKLRKVFSQPRHVIPDRPGDWDGLTNRGHPRVKGALLAACAEVFRDCVCAVTHWLLMPFLWNTAMLLWMPRMHHPYTRAKESKEDVIMNKP